MDYVIRPLTAADEPLLWDMVYQGVQSGQEQSAPSPEIVRRPELARYVENWGREGDTGFVAHDREKGDPLGAVWIRSREMSDSTRTEEPQELAFAVKPGLRRRGIGAALLTQWVKANPKQSSITLAVPATSPAVRLYERFGFKVVKESERAVTMKREV
jgi:ribosomal protein S18 acetylase RimI-like enzyme